MSKQRGKAGLNRQLFSEEHHMFRESVKTFLEREVTPNYLQWERDHIVPRSMFELAAKAGFLAMAVPEEYGGAGVDDFRFNAILMEEFLRVGAASFMMGLNIQNEVALPYFLKYGTEEQKSRWLPGIADGSKITAIVMSEPGTGSDLASIKTTAIREGDYYVVNGSKTFITNGINADLLLTAVKTDPKERHRGISMLVIEGDTPGVSRGKQLEKIGLHGQDTAEIFYDNVRVPVANLIGEEGKGFSYMIESLPSERLSIAVFALASARAALEWTLDYVKERKVFDKPIGSYQNTRMVLAELRAEIEIGQVFVDRCTEELNAGNLLPEQAAVAKLWCSELQGKAVDKCLQFFGGYGYTTEYLIGRAYANARITRIYGGANEIMKEIIAKSEDLD